MYIKVIFYIRYDILYILYNIFYIIPLSAPALAGASGAARCTRLLCIGGRRRGGVAVVAAKLSSHGAIVGPSLDEGTPSR